MYREHSEVLWNYAKASKTKGLKNEDQTQVWIDSKLYHKIEMLNLKCGKPVPTKHIVNAILQMFLDEHKTEIKNAMKSTRDESPSTLTKASFLTRRGAFCL